MVTPLLKTIQQLPMSVSVKASVPTMVVKLCEAPVPTHNLLAQPASSPFPPVRQISLVTEADLCLSKRLF